MARPTRSRRWASSLARAPSRPTRPRVGVSARHRRYRLPALGGSRGRRGLPRPSEALVTAHAVLVLGARDEQLRAGLTQLDALLELGIPSPQRLRVVVNGVGGPGATARTALEHVLARQLAERGFARRVAPVGRACPRSRAQRGGPLAAARPRGPTPARRGGCSTIVLPAGRSRAAERKLRLVPPAPRDEEAEEVALPWRS